MRRETRNAVVLQIRQLTAILLIQLARIPAQQLGIAPLHFSLSPNSVDKPVHKQPLEPNITVPSVAYVELINF